jgi:hypothetical protein
MKLRLTSALVLVLGVAVFAGPALADNGHGNGNANGNGNGNGNAAADVSASADSSQGKSDSAPGQVKKEAESVPPAPAEAPVVVAADEANSEGVKPSNSTAKDTHEAASSDKTKEYGNGRTAGQVAIANGAAPSTILHGPGNSQPHKAAGCAGGHEVDVHALKAKGHLKGCGSTTPPVGPAPQPGPGGNPGSSSNPGQSSNPHVAADPKPEASTPPADPATPPVDPGTKSDPASGVASGSVGHESHGVLAAAGVVAHGTLPFTGMQLWAVVLFALMLVGLGLALRRQTVPVDTNDQ